MQNVLLMSNGTSMRAIDIQFAYLEAVRSYLYEHTKPDAQSAEILDLWQQTLDSLNDQTGEHAVAARYIDWIAKFQLMQGYRDRDSLGWDSPRLSLIDLQYSDIDPARGIAIKLMNKGAIDTLFTHDQVELASSEAPHDTRAYFRGECVRRYPQNVAAASWDSIVFDTGGDTLLRIPTLEPRKGNRASIQDLLDQNESATDLLNSLRSHD
jgi:proteasome accessory factor A